jgi:outer membrane biosynthesis protein TonB
MRWSLATSFLIHAAILIAAFVVLPNPEEFKVQDSDPIPVDLVSLEDFSKRQAQTKTAEEPKPQKIAPKPAEVKPDKPAPEVAPEIKTAAREPTAPKPPEPVKKEEPKPEPKKEEVKKEEPKKEEPKKAEEPKPLDSDPLKDLIKDTVDEKPEPKKEEPKKETKTAETKPKDKPKPKPEKKKPDKDFNPDEISALLNKIDDKRTAPLKPTEQEGSPKKGEFNVSGADDGIAATLIDLLRQRISQCWSIPPGAREADITVRVRFQLNPDGSVIGMPEVLGGSGDPVFTATAQSAVAAVMECQNYDFLPADKYDLWREITFRFNPNQMAANG